MLPVTYFNNKHIPTKIFNRTKFLIYIISNENSCFASEDAQGGINQTQYYLNSIPNYYVLC